MVDKTPPAVEDIFADTDAANHSSTLTQPSVTSSRRPGTTTPLSVASQSTQPSPITQQPKRQWSGWTSKRTLLLVAIPLLVVVITAIVIINGPFGWGTDTTVRSESALTNQVSTNTTSPTTQQTGAAGGVILPVEAQVADRDGDGLSDDEERALGTDPDNPDTDRDGLNDYEEVKIYKTNPRNPDTDGDGNNDGVEVANGYNPNGPGLLRDLNAAVQQLHNE